MAIAALAGTAVAGEGTTDSITSPDSEVLPIIRENLIKAETPPPLIPLAPGAVRPEGWLRDWGESAANGITSKLGDRNDTFRFGWTGKDYKAKGEAGIGLRWPLEQSAYWLDGLIRLAYILDDPALKATAEKRLDLVVEGVNNGGETFIWWEPGAVLKVDGGDERFDRFTRNFNNWAHAHMGRALVAYYRASGKSEVLKALVKVYANYPLSELNDREFLPHGGATNLDPMLDTYALSGDKRILMNALNFAEGTSFSKLVATWATKRLRDGHTVLYYEHARVPAITSSWTGNFTALQASRRVLELGLKQHGLPVGLASGQEHLMGRGAIRELETCTVAAASWTNKCMLQVTGESQYADQMERAILNAGPASLTRDFNQACYFQTMNHIDSVVPIHTIKNIAGYEFSETAGKTLCCVANTNRFVPDYAQHMWMATLDHGLAATLYGPCTVSSFVDDGQKFTIHSDTDYPFNDRIRRPFLSTSQLSSQCTCEFQSGANLQL